MNKFDFDTLEEAIEHLKLDKRINWFLFRNKIVRKAKGDKLGHQYPDELIMNGKPVYVRK
jgi:hypothetical protein